MKRTLTNMTTHMVLVGDTELAWHGQHPLVPARGGVQPSLQEQGLDVGRVSSLASASLKIREDQEIRTRLLVFVFHQGTSYNTD